MQEPRIIDSNVITAGINVEELFEAQKDRFDDYDAAAAVNAAQKLRQRMLYLQGVPNDDSAGGSSSAEETSGLRKLSDVQGLSQLPG